MAQDSSSEVEMAFEAHLGRVAQRADAAREAARSSLVQAVRQATDLGWSQRKIGAAISRSQPEVHRLQHMATESAGGAISTDPEIPDVTLLDRVMEERERVVLAAARHGAVNVRLFGSVARGDDTAESDVDLLVDLGPHVGLFALGALEIELGEILGRPVDVVPARTLRPEVAATIESIPL